MQNKTMNGIFQNCLKLFVRKTLSVTNRYVVHLQKIHEHLLWSALCSWPAFGAFTLRGKDTYPYILLVLVLMENRFDGTKIEKKLVKN